MKNKYLNKYLIYPGHGVGQVTKVETKSILGNSQDFLQIKILETGMIAMVPIEHLEQTGVRELVDKKTALKILERLSSISSNPPKNTNWGRRYREFIDLIKSGDINLICDVYIELRQLKENQDLSFGERKLLDVATSLLTVELALVLKRPDLKLENKIYG